VNNSIAIDGIIFSLQRYGGISVYFKHLINELAISDFAFELVLESPLMQSLTDLPKKLAIAERRARLFERYRSCRLSETASIFHSSYYRLPSRRNLRTVVTVHDFIYERYHSGPRKFVHSMQKNSAIRAAQVVICISEATKQDLLEFVGETPGQQIHVIHNGVDDIFKKIVIEPACRPFVLFVGQRAGYKNFSLLLSAMAFLPELELLCVGGGAIRPEELNVVPDAVAKRVRHLGFVTDSELNILYNRALCLVYPSSYEGFGIPVVEAMRAGCPVVSLNCKAVLEVGRDALVVVPDLDPQLMVDAILKTVFSERASLVQRGLVVAQEYSWKNTHRKTIDVYQSLSS
jgi:mannosyltransferase